MNKRLKVEGGSSAQLVQLIRQISDNDDLTVEVASVISSPPSIKLKLADGIEITRSDVIMSQTAYDRLRAGDSAVIVCLNKKMRYFVLDKAVM